MYLGIILTNRNESPDEIKKINSQLVFVIVFSPKTVIIPKFRNKDKITLLLVLYGCETLSLTLREDYKLQMF
jgi:hypothetical protein